MSTISPESRISSPPPRSVLDLLDELRRRIRWYVVGEGLSMLVIWLAVAFWTGLAFDYLPVLVGANEMPHTARMVMLIVALLGACWVLYYYIARRVFRRFGNSSLALLIERQYPSFRDSLVTTIEMSEVEGADWGADDREAVDEATAGSGAMLGFGADMLAHTIDRAASGVTDVNLRKIFRYQPLVTKLLGALVAAASVVWLGLVAGETLAVGASRLLLLSSDTWPRRARIELVGFSAGEKKIAKGTDLIIHVRADATRDTPPPELCTILYETVDGDQGRVNMSRDGEPREGFQYYVFNGKPFKGILNDIYFDVIGYDHRLRDQRIKVVLSPVVTAVNLRSQLPDYTGLLPREEVWAPGTQLPIGSRITAHMQASKDLVSATIRDIDTGVEEQLAFPASAPAREFDYQIDQLEGRFAVAISLTDTDGIESLEPYLLTIGAVEDSIPNVDVSLRGIGSAITPVAQLTVEGRITDDYQVARSWFHVKLGDEEREFDFDLPSDDEVRLALDLRAEGTTDKQQPLVLEPQDRILFSVKASDKFDLGGQSHVGSNEQVALTVVRPDELLAILDGRELGLRRRFEQIRTETLQSRDSLARLQASFQENPAADPDTDPEVAAGNVAELRERWASWAGQKADQTALEVEGVALAFEDIREELINNRVDTPERQSRLDEQIIAPLKTIALQMFPEFKTAVSDLRQSLLSADEDVEFRSADVVDLADRIVVAMDAVLDKMLELEDYAELVNIIRSIIEQQEQVLNQTKEEQKLNVLELLK